MRYSTNAKKWQHNPQAPSAQTDASPGSSEAEHFLPNATLCNSLSASGWTVALHLALSDAVEFPLKDLLPELRLELLASLFIQLRSGWLVLRELPPIVRDLFGKGLFDPMELLALEALLERKYSEPLPKKNANKSHITGIPPPTSTGQASQIAA